MMASSTWTFVSTLAHSRISTVFHQCMHQGSQTHQAILNRSSAATPPRERSRSPGSNSELKITTFPRASATSRMISSTLSPAGQLVQDQQHFYGSVVLGGFYTSFSAVGGFAVRGYLQEEILNELRLSGDAAQSPDTSFAAFGDARPPEIRIFLWRRYHPWRSSWPDREGWSRSPS